MAAASRSRLICIRGFISRPATFLPLLPSLPLPSHSSSSAGWAELRERGAKSGAAERDAGTGGLGVRSPETEPSITSTLSESLRGAQGLRVVTAHGAGNTGRSGREQPGANYTSRFLLKFKKEKKRKGKKKPETSL